jgi:hypothetical protein
MDKQLLSEAEQAKAQADKLIRAIKRGNQGSIKEDADHLYARSKGICEKVFGTKMGKCPNCGAEIMIPKEQDGGAGDIGFQWRRSG